MKKEERYSILWDSKLSPNVMHIKEFVDYEKKFEALKTDKEAQMELGSVFANLFADETYPQDDVLAKMSVYLFGEEGFNLVGIPLPFDIHSTHMYRALSVCNLQSEERSGDATGWTHIRPVSFFVNPRGYEMGQQEFSKYIELVNRIENAKLSLEDKALMIFGLQYTCNSIIDGLDVIDKKDSSYLHSNNVMFNKIANGVIEGYINTFLEKKVKE